jgi:predicted transcriptional regulator
MGKEVSDEVRIEAVRKYILSKDVSEIEVELDVSEGTVRNILREFREGRYPEYSGFIPHVEAIRRFGRELEVKGISVANAIVGAIVFTGLLEFDIDPTQLQAIMTSLRPYIGNTPPAEFGRAVQQLVKLQQERELTFEELELLILNKKSDLDDILGKIKTATDEQTVAEAKKKKIDEDLAQTLKQNIATKALLDQFVAFRRAWRDAGFAVDSIGADMQAVSNLVQAGKSQGFLEASKELQRIETETGMDYKTIVQRYRENRELNEKTCKDNYELLAENNQLSDRRAELKREEAQQLKENCLTKERIERFLKIADRLKKAGFDID